MKILLFLLLSMASLMAEQALTLSGTDIQNGPVLIRFQDVAPNRLLKIGTVQTSGSTGIIVIRTEADGSRFLDTTFPAPGTGPQGPAGPAGASGSNGTNGTNGATGPAGPMGPAGATGATGPIGLTGSTGPMGPTGPAGAAGTTPTISIGSVVTGTAGANATVTNVGSSTAAIFNFSIPRGDSGTNAVATKIAAGSASISGALIASGTTDISITLSTAFSSTNYYAIPVISGAQAVSILGNLSLAVKSKTPTAVTVTAKNTGVASIAAGTVVEVIAYAP